MLLAQASDAELERVTKSHTSATAELRDVRDKFARHEEQCAKDRGKLDVELRIAQDALKKSSSLGGSMGTSYAPGGGAAGGPAEEIAKYVS